MFGSLRSVVNQVTPSRLTFVQSLTSLVAPPVCVLCGATGQRSDEPWGLDLCVHCEAACPRLDCAPVDPPPCCDSLHALFIYAAPVDQLILRLKFGHELAPARVLGTLLARHCRATVERLPDCIVPMPLHRNRLRERGFNQCREIARHLAPRLGLRVEPALLARCRDTAAQSGLGAADRAANVSGAFAVRPRVPLPGHVALLDDVMTTGNTITAAAGALKAAGVARVDAWVIARALKEDSSSGSA